MSPEPQQAPPLVTIGISTYNRAASTFPASLESALAQTYPELEVLVCDNASEDDTESLMRTLRDPRLRYHRHPQNIGASANFDSCLDMARGRYFVLLHDDDLLEPTFVERAMAAVARGGDVGVVLAAVELIDADGNRTGSVPAPPDGLPPAELFLGWFARRFSFYLCTTVFHRERLQRAGGFESPEGLFQDVVAIVRLLARHGYHAVPGTGGSFRRHANSRTAAGAARRWARDARFLLDTLIEEMPQDAQRLRAAGGPYLSNTSYRYVRAIESADERREVYREVFELFDRSYAPWRFVARTRIRAVRAALARRLAGARSLHRASHVERAT